MSQSAEKNERIGSHGFAGALDPGEASSRWETFSLGVFEWVPRSSGNGAKRGPAKVRVVGPTAHPDIVRARAQEIAEQLDAGTYNGPKNVLVKI